MSAKVLQFVRTQIPGRRPDQFTMELNAAYAALHGRFTEVMMTHAANDVGVLALVRFAADVIAEVSDHKDRSAEHLEMLLEALCRRARKP